MTTESADLILTGARLITLDPRYPAATTLAIHNGQIAAVGTEDDVRDWRGARTEVLDLHGATVTPGLVDSHLHPVHGLDMVAGIDLSGCLDLDDVRRILHAAAADAGPDQWVEGYALDPNVFGDVPITAAAIDDVLGGAPALLRLFDGHSALANTEALRRAGVDGPRSFQSRSAVVCAADGVPTGHLLEEGAMDLVTTVIPKQPFELRRKRLATLFADMAATGLTGGHAMDLDADALALLTSLEETDELPLRLRLAPWCRPDDDADRIRELLALQGKHGALWRVDAVKLFMDGTIDGGTAWLHKPDCHGESTDAYWLDPHEYSRAIRTFAEAGVQTATHAIGDAAVQHVLDTLAALPPFPHPARHRVEHIETLPTDQVPRFGELGVIASMQPTHATDYTLADHTDNWSRRLGDERADRAWRTRDILHAGAVVALGSDWPIAPFDPRGVLAAAQLRRPADRPDLAPVAPEQGLTATEALHGYTTAPAYAAAEEHIAGRIAPGCRADLTVFTEDPRVVAPDQLPALPVALTITAGRVRHQIR